MIRGWRLGRGLWLRLAVVAALAPGLARADIVLGDRQDGQKIRAPAGAALDVRLTSNPSTGFTWRLLGADPAVRLVSQRYDAPPRARRPVVLVGRPGVQSFHLKLVAPPGRKVALRFAYRRWWSKVGLARVWGVTLLSTPPGR